MFLLDEFVKLIDVLETEEISYATCGGIAMAIHGFVRATKDIDIIIDETTWTERSQRLDRAAMMSKAFP